MSMISEQVKELRDFSKVYGPYDYSKAVSLMNKAANAIETLRTKLGDSVWSDIKYAGLPPIGQPLIVTIKDNLQGVPNQLRYPVYYVEDTMKNQYCWKWMFGDMVYDLLPEVSEVIAWRLLPEPY